jgi:hypothetical protein
MSKRLFEWYQYIAPALLTPVSLWLWWRTYDGDLGLIALAWLIPIVYAYIVPGIGTNVLKVWEFDTRLRLGRFRPHHGFVFGSATATLAWFCHGAPAREALDVARTGFIFASVLGFWNVLYDIRAVKAGILRIYNQPWADRCGEEAVVMDYAPWFFAGYGAVYGAGLACAELLVGRGAGTPGLLAVVFLATLLGAMALPVWGYRRQSLRRHGHSGCRPVEKRAS